MTHNNIRMQLVSSDVLIITIECPIEKTHARVLACLRIQRKYDVDNMDLYRKMESRRTFHFKTIEKENILAKSFDNVKTEVGEKVQLAMAHTLNNQFQLLLKVNMIFLILIFITIIHPN